MQKQTDVVLNTHFDIFVIDKLIIDLHVSVRVLDTAGFRNKSIAEIPSQTTPVMVLPFLSTPACMIKL